MSNPPRSFPEGFQVSGKTNKDVTLAHVVLLNEDGLMWKLWPWREAPPTPLQHTHHILHRVARHTYSKQVQEESPGLKQSRLRGSGPGRCQEEREVDDSPDVPLLPSR